MLKQLRRGPVTAAIAGFLVFAVGMQTAHADLLGGDLPLLTAIIANTTQQIQQLAETISTLRKTYDEAKRVAGYADDAYQAFKNFQNFSGQVFAQNLEQALETAFPDLGYLRREASRTGPWAQGTGELQAIVRYCIQTGATGFSCAEAQEAITLKQARSALAATFGTTPAVAGAIEVNAMDHEAAVGMASSSAQVGRNAITRAQAKALMTKCTGEGDEDSIAACQAAANAAAILEVQHNADMGDQLAESTRLQAVRVAQENGRRKREINDAIERRRVLMDGARHMAPRQVQVRTEGVSFFPEGDH